MGGREGAGQEGRCQADAAPQSVPTSSAGPHSAVADSLQLRYSQAYRQPASVPPLRAGGDMRR